MEPISLLYEKTKELFQLLQSAPSGEERAGFIEKINSLLEERESLIKNLPKVYNTTDKKIGAEIVSLNKEISLLLDQLFNDIKTDLKNVRNKKSVLNKYANQLISGDGMFVDKRK